MPLFEIDIPAELASLIAVEAERRGTDVGQFLTDAIHAAVSGSSASSHAAVAPAPSGDAPSDDTPSGDAPSVQADDVESKPTPQERNLARIFARGHAAPNYPLSLNALVNDWARSKSTPEDMLSALDAFERKGWLRRAGQQDVILTDAGFSAIQRI